MADYVNWIDFFNLNKDAASQQAGSEDEQLREYENRLLQFENTYDDRRRAGSTKQYADYSDYQALMNESANRAARAPRVGAVDAALGFKDASSANPYAEALAKSRRRMGQAESAEAARVKSMRAAQEAQVQQYRAAKAAAEQTKLKQAGDRDRLARQNKLRLDRERAWNQAAAGKPFRAGAGDFYDWYAGSNNWGSAYYSPDSKGYAAGLSDEDRALLSEYDKTHDVWGEWNRNYRRD